MTASTSWVSPIDVYDAIRRLVGPGHEFLTGLRVTPRYNKQYHHHRPNVNVPVRPTQPRPRPVIDITDARAMHQFAMAISRNTQLRELDLARWFQQQQQGLPVIIRDDDDEDDGVVMDPLFAAAVLHFLTVVVPSHPSLSMVRLSGWRLDSMQIHLFTTTLLSSTTTTGSMDAACHLTRLDLAENPLLQAKGATDIAHWLQTNPCLEWLNLSACNIADHGFRSLIKALQHNTRLQVLFVEDNGITLLNENNNIHNSNMEVLRFNSLIGLSLAHNRIANEGCRRLALALRSDTSLTWLKLQDNLFDPHVALEAMEDLVKTFHFALRVLVLQNNNNNNNALEAASHKSCCNWNAKMKTLQHLLEEQNQSVRRAYSNLLLFHHPQEQEQQQQQELPQPSKTQYRSFPDLTIWDRILHRINSKPALIYQFLRTNVEPLGEHKQQHCMCWRRPHPHNNNKNQNDDDDDVGGIKVARSACGCTRTTTCTTND